MRALESCSTTAKIRALGVSNFEVAELEEAQAALDHAKIACNQVLYNLGERTVEDHELPGAARTTSRWSRTRRSGAATGPMRAARACSTEIGARDTSVGRRAVILAFLTRDPLAFTIPKLRPSRTSRRTPPPATCG